MIEIILATLATFGISALISNYDGLFGVFEWIRSKGTVFSCTVCLSVWIAIPIAYFSGIGLLGFLAVIGGVILIERVS